MLARASRQTLHYGRLKLTSYLLTVCGESTSAEQLPNDLMTCLHDFHLSHDAKMTGFAGYSMPVQYKDQSIVNSHLHTRKHVSLFDVSHMLQTKVFGKHQIEYMETLVPADVTNMKSDTSTLTVFLNEHGGIKDDLIVTKAEDHLYVVSNAACSAKDLRLMQAKVDEFRNEGYDVSIEPMKEHGLVAVQGPETSRLLQPGLSVNLQELYFMTSTICSVYGIPNCRISRCGYTGEDGVEISVDPSAASQLCERLLKSDTGTGMRDPPGSGADVKLAGLGARETLRIEAGLCLYGNDIDENRTPIEAGLSWLIHKRRRETAGFQGAAIVLKQLQEGVDKKRVGFICDKGKPIRQGAHIYDDSNKRIGFITSGCPSPTLKQNIAMGYVAKNFKGPDVRMDPSPSLVKGEEPDLSKFISAKIVKMPFVPSKYYTSKSKGA